MIYIKEINDVFIKVWSDQPHIEQELYDYFIIQLPAQWLFVYKKGEKQKKKKLVEQKVVLYKKQTKLVYRGLLNYVRQFAKDRNYPITYQSDFSYTDITREELADFIKMLKIPVDVRPYQFDAIFVALQQKRKTILSPTASGKSLIIYVVCMYCLYKQWVNNCLIIAPTTNLVSQLASDFVSYGCNRDLIHTIFYGHDKLAIKPITISTWQSIVGFTPEYFNKFGLFIGDEAHGFEAKSLVSICTRHTNCKFKIGFTGTLKDSKSHRLIIEGLFGDQHSTITTRDMIDKGYAAPLKINIVILEYPEEIIRKNKKLDYHDEVDFLLTCRARQKFVSNLATEVKGPTLILFQFVQKHGIELYNLIKEKDPSTHFVYGGVESEERELIRKIIMDSDKDERVVASMGTFSTGVNIPRLKNAIFANPTNKSKVRTLQSIGRTLRLHHEKDVATLYDVVDNLIYNGQVNYSLKHLQERIEMYENEGFDYEIFHVKLNPKDFIDEH